MKTWNRILVTAAMLLFPHLTNAHCDTMDGPVVAAAREAFARGDLAPVLIWVQPADEPAIRSAFERARGAAREGKAARELAEFWFFETLVRVHRSGEGAPYEGLKSGAPPEPGVLAADRAVASGNFRELDAAAIAPLRDAIEDRLKRVREAKEHSGHSVEAGRAYVKAYVEYMHLVEQVFSLGERARGTAAMPHQHSR